MSTDEPRLFIALYTDEDVTDLLARLLRQRGYDALSAHEAGMLGKGDDEQLAFAVTEGRTILTYNRDHFLALADEYRKLRMSHAGIIYSQQFQRNAIGELLRQVMNLLDEVPADEMRDTVRNLQSYR